MKQIALCGYYGRNNLGDDLMQLSLTEILSKHGKVTTYSDINAVDVFDSSDWINNDIIVVGGGGIINKSFWLFKELQVLIDTQKPVIFLNVNITDGDFNGDLFSQLNLLNAKWYVRDKFSYNLLVHILKFREHTVEYLPDVVFNRPYSNGRAKNKELTFCPNHYPFDDYFNLNSDLYFSLKDSILTIAKFLDWMISFGWKVNIMPSQTDDRIDDRCVGLTIKGFMKGKKHTEVWCYPVEDIIANSELVLSMRYHATLLAVNNGVPVIDILHHDKNRNFWKDCGQHENTVELRGLQKEQLIKAAQFAESHLYSKNNSYQKSASESWQKFNIN